MRVPAVSAVERLRGAAAGGERGVSVPRGAVERGERGGEGVHRGAAGAEPAPPRDGEAGVLDALDAVRIDAHNAHELRRAAAGAVQRAEKGPRAVRGGAGGGGAVPRRAVRVAGELRSARQSLAGARNDQSDPGAWVNRAELSVEMQVPAKDVLYTCEGTWALLDDATSAMNRDGIKRRSELAARGEARLRPHLLPQRRAHLPVAVPAG